jgi:glucose uptake protein GlcU
MKNIIQFKNFKNILKIIISVLALLYLLIFLFNEGLENLIESSFLHFGFWGLGLLFLSQMSLVACVIVTIFFGIKKIKNFIPFALTIFIASLFSSVVFNSYYFINGEYGDSLPGMAFILIEALWIFYFSFVVQAVTYLILNDKSERGSIKLKLKYIFTRLPLVIVFVILMFMLHGHIGALLHITPD